jgi:hypothetical protein
VVSEYSFSPPAFERGCQAKEHEGDTVGGGPKLESIKGYLHHPSAWARYSIPSPTNPTARPSRNAPAARNGGAREIGRSDHHRKVNATGRNQDELLLPSHGDDSGTVLNACSIAEILYRAPASESGRVPATLPDKLLRSID